MDSIRSRSVGRKRPQTGVISPFSMRWPKSPKSTISKMMSEADQKLAEFKQARREMSKLTTIRSDAKKDDVVDEKVDVAIRGMVIKEKIEEIDKYIGQKV